MKSGSSMRNYFVVLLVSLISSTCVGQSAEELLRSRGDSASAAHNARVNGLAAAAKRNKAKRQDAQYRSIVRDGTEIWEDSDGVFASLRLWKAGIYTQEGALCRVANGKVTIITKKGDVLNERISKLSEDCKKYVKEWREFEKLGKKRRAEWVESHQKKIEEEKLAAAEAARKKKEDELAKNRKMIIYTNLVQIRM